MAKLAKYKKLNLTKFKKSDLAKDKVSNFAKANIFETDLITSGAKKVIIHLQKTITKTLILCHFDPKRYIYTETNTLRYTIGKVSSQITLNQLFFNHMISKIIQISLSLKVAIGT